MAVDYPSTYPMPDSYDGLVSSGVLRSEGGGPELVQRQSYNSRRTDFTMTFSMDDATYSNWSAWMLTNGFDWFNMRVITDRTPASSNNYIYSFQRVRLTSPLSVSKRGYNWQSVTVQAELIPNDT